MWFAQLVNLNGSPKGDERDEIILAPSDKSDRRFTMYVNNGNGEFNNGFSIDPKMSCSNDRKSFQATLFLRTLTEFLDIRWGDVNGDGLDDFICVQTNGEL
jgi:hypothetical protein